MWHGHPGRAHGHCGIKRGSSMAPRTGWKPVPLEREGATGSASAFPSNDLPLSSSHQRKSPRVMSVLRRGMKRGVSLNRIRLPSKFWPAGTVCCVRYFAFFIGRVLNSSSVSLPSLSLSSRLNCFSAFVALSPSNFPLNSSSVSLPSEFLSFFLNMAS